MKVTQFGFHAAISWLDGTCLAEVAVNVDSSHGCLRNERVLFFRTVMGAVTDLHEALHSDSIKMSNFYGIKQEMLGGPKAITGISHPYFGKGDRQQPILGFYKPV